MLRERSTPRDEVLTRARTIQAACRRAGALFLVNHHVEVAAAVGADGVHLGFRSLAPERARAIVGSDAVIGASTHNAGELRRAIDGGCDYVTYGPIFDTPSKRGLVAPCGLDALRQAVERAAPTPVFALGGVGAKQIRAVRATGVHGVAFIRAVLSADEPARGASRIQSEWESVA